MMPNIQPGIEHRHEQQQPSWRNDRPANNGQAQRGHVSEVVLCHLCLQPDHYMGDCPTITPEVREKTKKGILALPEEQQRLLPRYSFYIAGIDPPENFRVGGRPQYQPRG